jgi:hypothetical protein
MRRVPDRLWLTVACCAALVCAAFVGYKGARRHAIRTLVSSWRGIWEAEDAAARAESYVPAGFPADAAFADGAFFLQDSANKVWIFTPALLGMTADVAVSRSRFMRVCGFDAAPVTKVSLPVNNRVYDGSLEEYLPALVRVERGSQIQSLAPEQAGKLLAAVLVFDYLFGPDNGLGWILERGGAVRAVRTAVYQPLTFFGAADFELMCPMLALRLGSSVSGVFNAPDASGKGAFPGRDWARSCSQRAFEILDAAAKAGLKPDLDLVSRTAYLIDEMPQETFLELFRIGGLQRTEEYTAYAQGLLERKRRMLSFLREALPELSRAYPESFNATLKKRYTIADFKAIISRQQGRASAAVPPPQKRQRMILMAESPEARLVTGAFRSCALDYDRTLAALVRLRGTTTHEREKEAVDFYIKELVTGHIQNSSCIERIPAAN